MNLWCLHTFFLSPLIVHSASVKIFKQIKKHMEKRPHTINYLEHVKSIQHKISNDQYRGTVAYIFTFFDTREIFYTHTHTHKLYTHGFLQFWYFLSNSLWKFNLTTKIQYWSINLFTKSLWLVNQLVENTNRVILYLVLAKIKNNTKKNLSNNKSFFREVVFYGTRNI